MRLSYCGIGFGLALGIGAAVGCSGSSPSNGPGGVTNNTTAGSSSCPAGSETCACYGNDTCNSGLTCASHLCVRLGAGGSPAVAGSGGNPLATSSNGGAAAGAGGIPSGVDSKPIASAAGASVTQLPLGVGGSSALVLGSGGRAAGGSAVVVVGGTSPAGGSSSGSRVSAAGGTAPTTVAAVGGTPVVSSSCGTDPQPAEFFPNYMVFVYDSSSSMGDDTTSTSPMWANRATRWEPMLAGMTRFFQSAGGFGAQASITFFPAPGSQATTCQYDYSQPNVASLTLSSPASRNLIDALNAQIPQGGTPTLPALIGGIKYAKKIVAKTPGSKAAVILVTDGEPYPASFTDTNGNTLSCAPTSAAALLNTIDDIASIAEEASTGVPPIQTYVVGIGDANRNSMGQIAAAGGTDLIYIDTTKNPAETAATLDENLNAISARLHDCTVRLPSKDFVPGLYNLEYKHSDGTIERLGMSEDCSRRGWRYASSTNPTSAILCPQLCEHIMTDPTGTLEYVQGCHTILL